MARLDHSCREAVQGQGKTVVWLTCVQGWAGQAEEVQAGPGTDHGQVLYG